MPVVTASVSTLDQTTRQVSDQNPNGTILGASTSDAIGFYGVAAGVTQPTQAAQAAIPQGASGMGNAAGALTQYTTSVTPAFITANTVAEQSLTVTGVLATDMLIVNRAGSQAGLGLAKPRVSAASQVKLTYANVTAASLTATAAESYLLTTFPSTLQLSATLTPAVVNALTIQEQSFTVTGLDTGMIVEVNKPSTQLGLGVMSSRVSAKNTLAITYANLTITPITPTAGEVYSVAGANGLVAASQIIEYGINVGTMASIPASSNSEQSLTENGIAATDIVVGISKPTAQLGAAISSGRVSAAGTIKGLFINPTITATTPTAGELYNVTTFRPSPASVMSVFQSTTLTPGSVPANSGSEQTFTVTGLTSGQPVAAAPNYNISASNGLGIAGVRVSATNTLAVTFINTTGAAITPPAGTWTVAQFNQPVATAANYSQQLVSPLQTVVTSLAQALRAALVNTGLIAGS